MIRVLVVDSDRELAASIAESFATREGFAARAAHTVEEGVALFDDGGGFDLLITEMSRPQVDGSELAIRLRRRRLGLPCVLLTGDEVDTAKVLDGYGVSRCVAMPASLDAIQAAADAVLEESKELGFQGHLVRISLIDIVQLYCVSGKTGRLDILHWGSRGAIYLGDGKIIHATQGDLAGPEAFYKLVSWDSGTFCIEFDVLPSVDTLSHESWHGLLIEAHRRKDEAGAGKPAPPPARVEHAAVVDPGRNGRSLDKAPRVELVGADDRPTARRIALQPETVEDLLALDAVEGFVVMSRKGAVLQSADLDEEEADFGLLTTFLGSTCEAARNSVHADRFSTTMIIERKRRKLLVVNTKNFFVGVVGSPHVQSDPFRQEVMRCLRSAARGHTGRRHRRQARRAHAAARNGGGEA